MLIREIRGKKKRKGGEREKTEKRRRRSYAPNCDIIQYSPLLEHLFLMQTKTTTVPISPTQITTPMTPANTFRRAAPSIAPGLFLKVLAFAAEKWKIILRSIRKKSTASNAVQKLKKIRMNMAFENATTTFLF